MNNTDKQSNPFHGLQQEKHSDNKVGLIGIPGSNERYQAQFLGAGDAANE